MNHPITIAAPDADHRVDAAVGRAVRVQNVSFSYGNRQALDDVSFEVQQGELFGLLGPNGGGKTTLFRLLATLLPVTKGDIELEGLRVGTDAASVRRLIGVTFQSASLDGKLTVGENLRHQAHLYGLFGSASARRIGEVTRELGIADRLRDRADSLSGGLKRRVEIAKSLLHRPQLLLLDEPSTGLDPGARHDLWEYLRRLQADQGVTVLVTTHLMEEAERCDRLAILDRGQLIALGTPAELRASIGGDCVTIQGSDLKALEEAIRSRFGVVPRRIGNVLRIEREAGHELLRDLVAALRDKISSISLAKPTLEDVFIARTGHRFWDETEAGTEG